MHGSVHLWVLPCPEEPHHDATADLRCRQARWPKVCKHLYAAVQMCAHGLACVVKRESHRIPPDPHGESPELYAQSAKAYVDARTKLLFKLSEILWHWLALCLELHDLACHALHIQELCNAGINLQCRPVNQVLGTTQSQQKTHWTAKGMHDLPLRRCTLLAVQPCV